MREMLAFMGFRADFLRFVLMRDLVLVRQLIVLYVLSADFGTSSVKLALVDRQGELHRVSKRSYHYTVRDADYVEIDPKALLQAFWEGVGEFGADLGQVFALAVDAFAPSLLLMDEMGTPLYPLVTHMDRRSRAQAARIAETFGEEKFLAATGTLPHAGGVTLTTLLWFLENEPRLMEKTYKIGHLTTYLYKMLTGEWAIDPVNACITGLYNTVSDRGWSEEIISAFGVPPRLLPPIRQVGEESAPLLPAVAAKRGLPKNTRVFLGTQDVAAAQIGAGNNQSGDVLMISGSSEMVSVLTDRPVIDQRYYLRRAAQPGLWQAFSITTGGFALDWFWREFCRELSEEEFFSHYLPELLESRQSAGGVKFSPYLSGDRQSMQQKTGSFLGLTLSTTREDVLYSILEGIQKQSIRTLALCEQSIAIHTPIKATGNLVDAQCYLALKEQLLCGRAITALDNCPLKGNALLAFTAKK